ncbi:MAG: hypothetical protein FWF85_07415, partial [Clostridiales bacterium]|nr:hypothetical protein [Clostridiales bacterium]
MAGLKRPLSAMLNYECWVLNYRIFSKLYVYSATKTFSIHPTRIFSVRWCGKTAGMLVAFQGFTAPPGGKKTVAGM